MTNKENSAFYGDADEYWKTIEPTVNGMLGGLEFLTQPDVEASKEFIMKFKEQVPDFHMGRALDCGAGIGRVTKEFLRHEFEVVDLVEQNDQFLSKARDEYLKEELQSGKVGELYCSGLQTFEPIKGRYSAIWSQWVLGHLTDDDLIAFLQRCQEGLANNGYIFIKENITKVGKALDEEDSSFTRSDQLLKELFEKAGLTLMLEQLQPNFPRELYKVKMYVLEPKARSTKA